MNTTFSFALLGAAIGMACLAAPVNAQTTIAEGSFHITTPSDPTLFGDFDVKVVQMGTLDTLTVIPMGGTILDASGVTATFFTGLNATGAKKLISTATGATDGPYDVSFSSAMKTVAFSQKDPDAYFSLKPFTGHIVLATGGAQSVRISLNDGGSQTKTLDFAATPEASSLALLLPGLIPVGMAFRRRRANRA